MSTLSEKKASSSPLHAGQTARDLMTPNPVPLLGSATVPEVVAFLTETGFSAAPVIDEKGRPIGVVSRTDVVVYDHARASAWEDTPGYYHRANLAVPVRGRAADPSRVPQHSAVRASDLMTPEVFSVTPETPARAVAAEMVRLNVHRLFVVDDNGTLLGVLSALDLLAHFAREGDAGKK